jgi:hypothetical protein
MAKDKKLFSKILLILFLIMIVLGFTLPGFLEFDDENQYVEPKICQTDADCYLMCDDNPIEVLCSQNLCQQNSCTEGSYYTYTEEAVTFSLEVEIDDELIDLDNQSNDKDIFVKFDNDVKLYSSLNINHVLEKLGLNSKFNLFVNDEESYDYTYLPQEGDKVMVVYG